MKWLPHRPAGEAVSALVLGDGAALVRVERGGALPRVTHALHGDATADTLRAWSRRGAFKNSRLLLMLRPAQRSIHTLASPEVPETELAQAVRWQLATTLEYPPEEALLDVLPLPALADNQPPQVMAICARLSEVQALMQPLLAAGLRPQVIDVQDLAQRNLSLLASAQAPASACIGFDGQQALLTLTAGGELCVSRALVMGDSEGIGGVGAVAERLALQLQRTLDTFERQATNFAVRRLHLLPGPWGEGFAQALAGNLAQPVEAVQLEALFDLSALPADDLRGALRHVHLLGAAAGRLPAITPEAVAA